MEIQPTPHILPGSPEASAALQRFKAYAMSHTLLAEVDKQISRAIYEPAGFSFVLSMAPAESARRRSFVNWNIARGW